MYSFGETMSAYKTYIYLTAFAALILAALADEDDFTGRGIFDSI